MNETAHGAQDLSQLQAPEALDRAVVSIADLMVNVIDLAVKATKLVGARLA